MKIVLLLCVLVLPSTVHGMVFSWTDPVGITHFTNKEYEIPARFRVKAKQLYPEQSDTAVSPQSGSTPSPKPDTQPAAQQTIPVSQQPVVGNAPPVKEMPTSHRIKKRNRESEE
jgi:hypothetical protein